MICRTVLFAEETIKVNCVCLNVNQVSELISDLTTANKVQQPVSSLTDRPGRRAVYTQRSKDLTWLPNPGSKYQDSILSNNYLNRLIMSDTKRLNAV